MNIDAHHDVMCCMASEPQRSQAASEELGRALSCFRYGILMVQVVQAIDRFNPEDPGPLLACVRVSPFYFPFIPFLGCSLSEYYA